LTADAPAAEGFKRAFAPRLLLAAAAVGAVAGAGGVVFRLLLSAIQWLAFGSGSEMLVSALAGVPAWRVVLAPALGGLAVGLIYRFVIPGHFPLGPADAIAAAWRGTALPPARSLAGTMINAASLGVGASVGREGPIVLLGGALGSWIARAARPAPDAARTLLAAGVAACVAASFNAPAAGAIFALEVVLLGYRLVPLPALAVASLVGTLVGRAGFGDVPIFPVPSYAAGLAELPAFALLGVVGAALALAMMLGIFLAAALFGRLPGPWWLRTGFAGLFVGIVALSVPEVLSYGQEAAHASMLGRYELTLLLAIVAAKLAATAISLGGGFGGGVFSPSLVLGAALGGAFGHALALVFPGAVASPGAYAVIGAAAVSAPVLGAPVSTVLILLEMTEAWRLAPGMAIAALVATAICRPLIGRSFFTWQLKRRGVTPTSVR
jgi:CIC family chloride channel protein